MVHTCTLTARL